MCVLKVKYIIIAANTALFQIRLQPIGDCKDWTVSYCSLVYFRVVLCVTSTCIVCNAHIMLCLVVCNYGVCAYCSVCTYACVCLYCVFVYSM